MRVMIAALLLVLLPINAFANCPIGSFPSFDRWGNQICQRFDGGPPAAIQGTLDNCPIGTHPWADQWGNRTCKSLDSPQQHYDTSRGCPIGTYQWADQWGNQACKRF